MRSKLYIFKIVYLHIVFSFLCVFGLQGQEMLKQIPTVHSSQGKDVKKSYKSGQSLELPFFDDFSDSYYSPDPNKWSDNFVFINQSYAVAPPSIGVATFDAVDNMGEFYPDASYGNLFDADMLTSLPINLNYPSDNSIFLSFYFQPQGLGDNPEAQDILFLEFYSPETLSWDTVWKQAGSVLKAFQQKIIHISDSKYLKDGFRFRFRNKASLSGDNDPTKVMNCDQWNIDYVYLNKNRNINDTVAHDLAFVYPMSSLLKNYESIPWKHFLSNSDGQLLKNVTCYYRNNDNSVRLIDSLYYVIHDNSSNRPNDTLTGGSYDVQPFSPVTKFDPAYLLYIHSASADSASFNVKARLVTNTKDPASNNEIVYVQKFYDYYAYDDGSAEAGYGLTGDGAQNAQLACKFDCLKEDTLKAIQMYFNRSFLDKNQSKYFYLTVWRDNNGEPGEIIYKRKGTRPEFEDELNKFHTYFIDDTVLVLSGTFYVGWIQTTADFLNLGFDYNRDRKLNNFYNINGIWKNSSYSGSWMIRPYFGKNLTTGTEIIKPKTGGNFKIYPNPTKDGINIQLDNLDDYQYIKVSIYSLSGALIYQVNYTENQTIDVSGLSPGIYIIHLSDKTRKLNYSQKLIKIN